RSCRPSQPPDALGFPLEPRGVPKRRNEFLAWAARHENEELAPHRRGTEGARGRSQAMEARVPALGSWSRLSEGGRVADAPEAAPGPGSSTSAVEGRASRVRRPCPAALLRLRAHPP